MASWHCVFSYGEESRNARDKQEKANLPQMHRAYAPAIESKDFIVLLTLTSLPASASDNMAAELLTRERAGRNGDKEDRNFHCMPVRCALVA
ncbi:hypothetical protein [Bradyrhizobium nanningense]|nr:hypothetical protein [Bradyrhizobium nanningense]